MKIENKNFFNILAFVSLFLIAIITVINVFLPLIGIELGGTTINILEVIEKLITLIVIAYFAYPFVSSKSGKGWKIAYFIAIAIFVLAIVLIFFRKIGA